MTTRRAERITGLSVRRMDSGRNWYGLYDNGSPPESSPLLYGHGPSPATSLANLVEKNYARMRNRVFAEQNYRCFACYGLRGLSCDHIKPRSHGRSDLRPNLRGLCSACHENHTLNRPISIHPKMVEVMSNIGLRWIGEWSDDLHPHGWERIS